MSKNNTNGRIQRMCAASKLDENELYERAKLLLEVYRDVCWSTVDYVCEVKEELQGYGNEYCSDDMDAALIYLENFAPDEGREKFEDKIRGLFETRWMIEIVDSAMIKVKECPVNGELYFSLLSDYYLNRFMYTEKEMLEEYNIERSTYYRRKREAIKIFGIAVWGSSITDLKRQLFDTGGTDQIKLQFTKEGDAVWGI